MALELRLCGRHRSVFKTWC